VALVGQRDHLLLVFGRAVAVAHSHAAEAESRHFGPLPDAPKLRQNRPSRSAPLAHSPLGAAFTGHEVFEAFASANQLNFAGADQQLRGARAGVVIRG
jgi:hypothetical protein